MMTATTAAPANSIPLTSKSREEEMQKNIRFDAVNAVEESWNVIKRIPNYEQIAGELLFRRVFELAPSALALFPFGTDPDDESADQASLYSCPIFIAHATSVVQMLDAAINMLGPDTEPLERALRELGARHTTYGVDSPDQYGIVGQALLETLEQALGEERWTSTVKEGWAAVYDFVSSAMLAGADEYLQKCKQRRSRVRQQQQQQQVETAFRKSSRKDSMASDSTSRTASTTSSSSSSLVSLTITSSHADIDANNRRQSLHSSSHHHSAKSLCSSFNDSDHGAQTKCERPLILALVVEQVSINWDQLRTIPDYEVAVGKLLFQNIFRIAPAAKQLFSFGNHHDDSLFSSPAFMVHSRNLMRMLDAAIHMLGPDLEPLTETLLELGFRHHSSYGITVEHYPIVGQALLEALETLLGNSWTATTKQGWSTIFSFVSSTMIQGATAGTGK